MKVHANNACLIGFHLIAALDRVNTIVGLVPTDVCGWLHSILYILNARILTTARATERLTFVDNAGADCTRLSAVGARCTHQQSAMRLLYH